MTRTEHLLVCLAEEAAEIQKAVSKALRFGLQDGYPGTDRTNARDIMLEFYDLAAIIGMLQLDSDLPNDFNQHELSHFKRDRVEKYLKAADTPLPPWREVPGGAP